METYNKINTLYKRNNQTNKIILNDYSNKEIEYLKDCKFECTEKIDGTNIKVGWDGYNLSFEGKTENAQIPAHLLLKLKELFTVEKMQSVFPIKRDENGNEISMNIILYGEGYGMKIQKGGNYIKDSVGFILFDIKIGNWWLERSAYQEIANQLNIDVVPLIGYLTIKEAENLVSIGFKSTISENKEYQAEGLVCKPLHTLFDRSGKRVLVKIKTVDYRNL